MGAEHSLVSRILLDLALVDLADLDVGEGGVVVKPKNRMYQNAVSSGRHPRLGGHLRAAGWFRRLSHRSGGRCRGTLYLSQVRQRERDQF